MATSLGVTPDTGLEVFGKWVELLKELFPRTSRIAILEFQGGSVLPVAAKRGAAKAVARELGVTFTLVQHAPFDYADAFALLARERPDAILVAPSAEHYEARNLIVEFAAKNRLPAMYTDREYVVDGGLIAYGPNLAELFRRMAGSSIGFSRARNQATCRSSAQRSSR